MTTQATVDFAQSLTYIASMNWYAGRPTTAASTIVRNTYILITYKIAGVQNCMFSGHAGACVRGCVVVAVQWWGFERWLGWQGGAWEVDLPAAGGQY